MTEKIRTVSFSGVESDSDTGHDSLNTSIISDNVSSIMNTSHLSNDSHMKTSLNIAHNISGSICRFPKLEECAHFHYERVQLGRIQVRAVDEKMESSSVSSQQNADNSSQCSNRPLNYFWFILKVSAGRSEPFLIKRSLDNLKMLDEMLHRCVYDRRISDLRDLNHLQMMHDEHIEDIVSTYFQRFTAIASDAVTCGQVLTWLQLDNKGRRLPVADSDTMRTINTPAVGAAYGVRRYVAQACDEISIDVGDMISVIDMPSPAESVWWRGKKSHLQKNQYEVGFFPQSCVATIGDKVPRHMPLPAPLVGSLALSPTKPVLRKHGKLIAFFRSFILARPSRRRLKQSGIYRERVFSCDLSEHLLNSQQEIPMVLKCCAEFIEEYGIVDGIYRLSGITSNIQKLRRAFDEERIPELSHPDIRQDIHAVSSLLKMYFRELPNPLCTYQLYDNFVEAIQSHINGDEELRLRLIKQTVRKLPPPHYRTLKYLASHLYKISRYSESTGMTERNIAIVWAPNLLRSPSLEAGGVAALRGVGVQAVVTEYLISHCEKIFDDTNDDFGQYKNDSQPASLSDTASLREQELSFALERPKSLSVGGAKLLSLEEAQSRKNQIGLDLNKVMLISTVPTHSGCSTYIEVGGGPANLPEKYHTVLPVPRSWNKRKPPSWKSIFSRTSRQSTSNTDVIDINVTTPTEKAQKTVISPTEQVRHIALRPNKESAESSAKDLTKSVDMFDGKSINMDVCPRSGSADSLRTTGHSRSVSHDSYFDLLQSPLRGLVTCPSRELSELGINFDREESEMRIFSESESLVSSPKVSKECPRRMTRARPEDYANTGQQSVNPSPKKQPRLNISPTATSKDYKLWSTQPSTAPATAATNTDESLCKRYKLEDQLSDIQYIDCNTPEHIISRPMPNTGSVVYASVQIHNPPPKYDSVSSSTMPRGFKTSDDEHRYEAVEQFGTDLGVGSVGNRYSYPTSTYGFHKATTASLEKKEGGRYSLPATDRNGPYDNFIFVNNNSTSSSDNNDMIVEMRPPEEKAKRSKPLPPPKALRHSYIEKSMTKDQNLMLQDDDHRRQTIQIVSKSLSVDVLPAEVGNSNKTKLNVATPQSPAIPSPGYSLLIGSTSSDATTTNSSDVMTPTTFDMDHMHQHHHEHMDDEVLNNFYDDNTEKTKDSSNNFFQNSNNSISSSNKFHSTSQKHEDDENQMKMMQKLDALKRELSLDLNVLELPEQQVAAASPNTITQTSDNTSQSSLTPSEFGYHHLLNRDGGVSGGAGDQQSSNFVSLESSPKSGDYENLINYENVWPTIVSAPTPNTTPTKQSKPTTATISITYNLRSPITKDAPIDIFSNNSTTTTTSTTPNRDLDKSVDIAKAEGVYENVDINAEKQAKKEKPQKLLETTFDENIVYEQVKYFRNSICQVNDIIGDDDSDDQIVAPPPTPAIVMSSIPKIHSVQPKKEKYLLEPTEKTQPQVVPDIILDIDNKSSKNQDQQQQLDEGMSLSSVVTALVGTDDNDVQMLETDSLEFESQNLSLYENVELRHPAKVYENVDLSKKSRSFLETEKEEKKASLLPTKDTEMEFKLEMPEKVEAQNFSVRQLANKFETSPVEVPLAFDFNLSSKPVIVGTRKSESPKIPPIRAGKQFKDSNNSRSLDENAFIREFGGSKKFEHFNKSIAQIPEIEKNQVDSCSPNRRKSIELPKMLNLPKKLPELKSTTGDTEVCKQQTNDKLKFELDFGRKKNELPQQLPITDNKENELVTADAKNRNLKITPTTENPISLIQLNYDTTSTTSNDDKNSSAITDDERNCSSLTSLRMLGSFKLDRERIEKIKEERRLQLNEKYRSESLNIKIKSKSRPDVRDLKEKFDERTQSDSFRFKSKSRVELTDAKIINLDSNNSTSEQSFASLISTTTTGMPTTGRTRRISDEKNQNDYTNDAKISESRDNKFDVKLRQKFEKKNFEFNRERELSNLSSLKNNQNAQRDRCFSPQISIKDVAAMFESRSHNS